MLKKNLPWLLFTGLVVFPLVLLFVGPQGPSEQIFPSLLAEARWNTLFLAIGVLILSSLLGVSTAWILFYCPVWGRDFLSRGFFFPLIFPAYVLAFVLLGALVHTSLSPQGQLWGLVLVLSFALYPYIYIFTRAALSSIGKSDWEVQNLYGRPFSYFLKKVIIPKIFPLYLSALVLVLFETLADFGAASILNVPVMTTMIYKSWFDLFSFAGAVKLSAHYLLIIGLILLAEAFLKRKVASGGVEIQSHSPIDLPFSGLKKGLATAWCWFLFLLSVVFPVLQISFWFFEGLGQTRWESAINAIFQTLCIGVACAALVALLSLLLSYFLRLTRQSLSRWESVSSVGYSVPGTILAVALFAFAFLLLGSLTYWTSLVFLVLGLTYKFFPVGLRQVGGKLQTIPRKYDEFSQSAGVGVWRLFKKGHWPLLNRALWASFALVMIEVMKEMPLTLMLAPSSFETLSIQIFNFTSEGEWEKAAVPGMLLLVVGSLSVQLIFAKRGGNGHTKA